MCPEAQQLFRCVQLQFFILPLQTAVTCLMMGHGESGGFCILLRNYLPIWSLTSPVLDTVPCFVQPRSRICYSDLGLWNRKSINSQWALRRNYYSILMFKNKNKKKHFFQHIESEMCKPPVGNCRKKLVRSSDVIRLQRGSANSHDNNIHNSIHIQAQAVSLPLQGCLSLNERGNMWSGLGNNQERKLVKSRPCAGKYE